MIKNRQLSKSNSITKRKIFNDPVYGFINFSHSFLYELIDHPYVQRLRRIKQLGLTDYVYSGASHSRFNHCLGTLHLMTQAIQSLRWKGVEITNDESEAVCIAILLHDVGHGPFSHALEKMILPYSHEQISIKIMEMLNKEYNGKLDLAIRIFTGKYNKPFLFQLVASQLDMDRMDYLNRDSFYTGVVEGMIGYDRIIKMLNVVDGKLVVEEKGILSVEQFLMARRMMYWQVYLHKTVLAVEKMLLKLFDYIHDFKDPSFYSLMTEHLAFLLKNYLKIKNSAGGPDEKSLRYFMELDDSDILLLLKNIKRKRNDASQVLANGILDRHVFKIILKNSPILREFKDQVRLKIENEIEIDPKGYEYLLIEGSEINTTYKQQGEEIQLLMKNGSVIDFTKVKEIVINTQKTEKFFLIFPRSILI